MCDAAGSAAMTLHELTIGGATIGGPLGSRPGLLVGSIFYDKHSLVTDAFAGIFDEDRAARLLARVDGLASRYGLQMAIDVLAASPEAMERYLVFVAARTGLPLLINATEAEVRISGLATAGELGILDRCIFASLNEDTEDAELDALHTYHPGAVMVLANDVSDPTPEGSCEMVANHFRPILDDLGVAVPIVDLGAMDPPSIGIAMRGVAAIRERFGYPAGCAFSNAFPGWTGLRELGREWWDLSLASALVAVRSSGADFLHYGLIEKAAVAAHAAGTAEVFFGFAAQEVDGLKLADGHPLLRMFKLAVPA
jgi:tetrahydromethanopterin S-methyltransferase subunit H